jgi:glycosyltransferase involved in cell wall biosynthesis
VRLHLGAVLLLEADGALGKLFENAAIPTVTYPAVCPSYRHPLPYWQGVLRFRKLLQEHRIALVHAADMPAGMYAAVASRLAGIPSLCHIRSNYPDLPARYKPLFACISRFAFASRATWSHFNRIWNVPAPRGEVVYDWAPLPGVMRNRQEVRAEFGVSPDALLIGMVARIAPPKDHETLLRACALLARLHPRFRLLLVGDGDLSQVRRLGSSLGINDNVILAGYRACSQELMAAMDIHVLCTRGEGFGLVLLEAMAVGTPVVASRVGGIPEIVSHNDTGLLHECGNAEELAACLAALAGDPLLGRRLAASGLAAAGRFSRARTVTQMEGIYRSIGNP